MNAAPIVLAATSHTGQFRRATSDAVIHHGEVGKTDMLMTASLFVIIGASLLFTLLYLTINAKRDLDCEDKALLALFTVVALDCFMSAIACVYSVV